ncbi:MAG: FAD-dependent oxidoreductase [Deltaproteobacteria bacterium]|nr:FAD-dependent oxidoreductase [Deltaproteobacteria bacterium]
MYDLVIIGGGPGGLTAGIYAQRAGLKTVLIEKEFLGGQIAVSDVIENYPGFPTISGPGLMEKFEAHARGLGLEIRFDTVLSVVSDGRVKLLKTTEGELAAKTVIVSTGAKPKRLDVPGERELTGKGVSYCATCDGPFFRNKEVMVVGGGDTAVKEAIYLSKLASKVHIVHRRDKFRAEKVLVDKMENTPNMVFHKGCVLREIKSGGGTILGGGIVTGAVLEELTADDASIGKKSAAEILYEKETLKEVAVEGVFIFVGINPTTDFVDVEKDDGGFIKTNQNMETSVPGVYAIGDCRVTPLRQVSTAVGDGAIAAHRASVYIESLG